MDRKELSGLPKEVRRRRKPVYLGRTTWWEEAETHVTAPAKIRPPSQADGSVRVFAPTSLDETQVTESENHPGWLSRKRGRWSGDVGGEFFMQRQWMEVSHPQVLTWERYRVNPGVDPPIWNRLYRFGPLLAMNPHAGYAYPSYFPSSEATLNAWGAKAIAACKPTNPATDMSTFLGEIAKEGIPKLIGASLWRDKSRVGRKMAADEYLNVEFGWEPIAREIGSMAAAIWNAETALKQFRRDVGKLVRRRFEFPPEYTVSYDTVESSATGVDLGFSSGRLYDGKRGKVLRKRETLRRRWFSGAFTYYLPSDGNVFGAMSEQALLAKKTLGLSLTPDVVWNLAPWSWAVDWFVNAGDVISNMTDWAYYSLCLRYGYIMEHTISTDTYTYAGSVGHKRTSYIPAPMKLRRETKIRKRANPFGFGVTWNGLNPYQLAIAAALGIKRWG